MVGVLYRLHEAGKDYTKQLRDLAAFVGQQLTKSDVRGAFGSIDAEMFAKQLLLKPEMIPADLNEAEMLHLIEQMKRGEGDEFQDWYWMKCLELNTRDERVSDLFYWPGEYFGDGDDTRDLTAKEILQTALASGRKGKNR